MTRSVTDSSLKRAKALMFKKRKNSIKKKAMELGILCDIPICAVILGPNGEVETYPENQSEVKAILKKYKDHCQEGSAAKNHLQSKGNNENIMKIQKDVASNNIGSSSEDFWIGIMNNLNSKIAAIDHRIELLKKASDVNCFEGIRVQDLHSQHWCKVNGAVDEGLMFGWNQSLQNLGSNNYTMVHDIAPIRAFEPVTCPTSLGCHGNAASTCGTNNYMMVQDIKPMQVFEPVSCPTSIGCQGNAASSSGTSHYPHRDMAACAGCASFGYASDDVAFNFMDNIDWDQNLQLGPFAGAEHGLLELFLQPEPVIKSNSSA